MPIIVAAPATVQGRRSLTGFLHLEKESALFLVVNLLDFLLTWTLLFTGHFHEGNPLPAFFLNHWGVKGLFFYKLVVVLSVCGVVQAIAARRLETGRKILIFGSWLAVGVVFYSLYLSLHAPQ